MSDTADASALASMPSPLSPLLSIPQMPEVTGLDVPRDLYWVLLEPAHLAGMAAPTESTPWTALGLAGLRHVVCLTHDVCPYDPAPLSLLLSHPLDDLLGGGMPHDPDREEDEIRRIALTISRTIRRGDGVVVHCAGGTGRTGTVLGCTLRLMGYQSADILEYLDRLNQARGRRGWPESRWQADLVERMPSSTPTPGKRREA